MRIFTGSYENCKIGNLVSISGDKGKSVNFIGETYLKLAPKRDFWRIWKYNIGKVNEEENNNFYMREYYKKVLSDLNPEEVMQELKKFGQNVVLLCYEENQDFCHRQLVATWLERKLQIEVPEISIDKEGNIKVLERNKKYVEKFNNIMSELEKREELEI